MSYVTSSWRLSASASLPKGLKALLCYWDSSRSILSSLKG